MLWYLTPPKVKMEMIQSCRDKANARLMMLMLMEEIIAAPLILVKTERHLQKDYKAKLYMHFFMFATMETLSFAYKRLYVKEDATDEKDMLDYIRFLENQLISTNYTKKIYLKDVEDLLKENHVDIKKNSSK